MSRASRKWSQALRRRCAILHIGTGKTGSTTIQNLLAANRDRLMAQGFAYPVSPGHRNHLLLAVFASDERRAVRMLRITAQTGSPGFQRERLAVDLGAELAALPDAVHTVIFSSEHLANQVASMADAARLKALLDTWFDDYRILVYLRRQDEYEVSLYSTLLRAGQTGTAILPPADGARVLDRHDWIGLLDRWGAAFGRAALLPRIFDRGAFVDGDLLADMRAACGLAPLPVPEEEATLNPSLTAPAQEFLRRLNLAARGCGGTLAEDEVDEAGDADGHPEGDREAAEEPGKAPSFIRQFLDSRFSGTGRLPSRAEAEAFVARHAAGNERVRAEFFPARASLFSTDFTRYPEVADPLPGGEALVEVAIAVTLAQNAEHSALLADSAARRGRERLSEAPEEARRLFRRALARQATHLGALRGLVDLARDPAARDEAEGRLARALAQDPDRRDFLALRQRLQRLAPAQPEPREERATAAPQAGNGAAAPAVPAARAALTPEERLARRAALSPEERAAGRAAADQAGEPQRPAPKVATPDAGRPRHSPEERAARRERRAERLRRRDAVGPAD